LKTVQKIIGNVLYVKSQKNNIVFALKTNFCKICFKEGLKNKYSDSNFLYIDD